VVKAQNPRRLVADHPGVQRVRTSVAADNEQMLRVNRQLGLSWTLLPRSGRPRWLTWLPASA
jgi:RimJ/RimL family protein N-acetyltransferase